MRSLKLSWVSIDVLTAENLAENVKCYWIVMNQMSNALANYV